jgi:hypothetical protein
MRLVLRIGLFVAIALGRVGVARAQPPTCQSATDPIVHRVYVNLRLDAPLDSSLLSAKLWTGTEMNPEKDQRGPGWIVDLDPTWTYQPPVRSSAATVSVSKPGWAISKERQRTVVPHPSGGDRCMLVLGFHANKFSTLKVTAQPTPVSMRCRSGICTPERTVITALVPMNRPLRMIADFGSGCSVELTVHPADLRVPSGHSGMEPRKTFDLDEIVSLVSESCDGWRNAWTRSWSYIKGDFDKIPKAIIVETAAARP